MALDPMNEPDISAFPITKLGPLLRAVADPTGSGDLSPEDRAAIDRVEANLAACDDDDVTPPRSS
ncbi:MAG: hypothetical protein JWR63_602 [Conexibacter sp.]|nr:hypothetical protein [Conexibacter sp.]